MGITATSFGSYLRTKHFSCLWYEEKTGVAGPAGFPGDFLNIVVKSFRANHRAAFVYFDLWRCSPWLWCGMSWDSAMCMYPMSPIRKCPVPLHVRVPYQCQVLFFLRYGGMEQALSGQAPCFGLFTCFDVSIGRQRENREARQFCVCFFLCKRLALGSTALQVVA